MGAGDDPMVVHASEETTMITVTVPAGVGPGQLLTVQAPSGVMVQVMVPENAPPGSRITLSVPAAHRGQEMNHPHSGAPLVPPSALTSQPTRHGGALDIGASEAASGPPRKAFDWPCFTRCCQCCCVYFLCVLVFAVPAAFLGPVGLALFAVLPACIICFFAERW